MRGSKWIETVETVATGTGWLTAGVGQKIRSPLPEYLEGDQETAAVSQLGSWLADQGGPGELMNLGRLCFSLGASYGWPGDRWERPALEIFRRDMLPSISFPQISRPGTLESDGSAEAYLREVWGLLADSGLGESWAQFTGRIVGSYADKIGTNIPIVNLIVGIARLWIRGIRGRIASIGVPDYSSAPKVRAWMNRSGALSWNYERDETEALSIAALLEQGREITPLFLPRSTQAEATTVAFPGGGAAFYLGVRAGSPTLEDKNMGYAPGTDMVIRGFQNPVFTGEWIPTGGFALTARSMCSQAWQLVASGHPIQGAVNLVGVKNDWRRYTRSLAAALLRPYDWLGNPIPPRTGSYPDWRGHAPTLRTLWNTVASQVGWPPIEEAYKRTRGVLGLTGNILSDDLLDEWAGRASRAIDDNMQGFSDAGIQGLVETSTMSQAAERLQDQQRENFRGDAPPLLAYVPVDGDGAPIWPGARMSAGQRRTKLTAVVRSQEVCSLDADSIPDGPDAEELRSAIRTQQSGCTLALTARPAQPPPPLVQGYAAGPASTSIFPGWLLPLLGVGGVGYWLTRRGL